MAPPGAILTAAVGLNQAGAVGLVRRNVGQGVRAIEIGLLVGSGGVDLDVGCVPVLQAKDFNIVRGSVVPRGNSLVHVEVVRTARCQAADAPLRQEMLRRVRSRSHMAWSNRRCTCLDRSGSSRSVGGTEKDAGNGQHRPCGNTAKCLHRTLLYLYIPCFWAHETRAPCQPCEAGTECLHPDARWEVGLWASGIPSASSVPIDRCQD